MLRFTPGLVQNQLYEILFDLIEVDRILPQETVYRAYQYTLFSIPMIDQATTHHSSNRSNAQKFLHRNDSSFDLVINGEFYLGIFFMIGHIFKTPLITICEVSKFILTFDICF